MMKHILFAVSWVFAILLLMGGVVYAQNGQGSGGQSGGGITLTNPLSGGTIGEVIQNIIGGLQLIAIPLVAIMILIGAFQMLFAAGNPEKFAMGKKTVIYTIIGYAILLLAGGVTSIIRNLLGAS